MKRTQQNLSIETSLSPHPFGATPPRPAHFTVLLKLHRDQMSRPRKLPVEHLSSPRSSFPLTIAAMQTCSATAPRRDSRRQFRARLHSL